MSKRVLLGKIDSSDYGLLVSRAGVDVVDDSGNLCNNDQLIFDSRQKGYGQLIFQETITMTRSGITFGSTSNAQTRTFSSIEIPNPIIIVYGNVFVKVTSTTTTQVTFNVPYFYPGFATSHPQSQFFLSSYVGQPTPASQSLTYAVIRGPA